MKLFVQEKTVTNHDGDKLVVIKTFKSKPAEYNYIVWER